MRTGVLALTIFFLLIGTGCDRPRGGSKAQQNSGMFSVHGSYFPVGKYESLSIPGMALRKPWYYVVKDLSTSRCIIVPASAATWISCSTALSSAAQMNNALRTAEDLPYLFEEDKADACDVEECAENPDLAAYCPYYKGRVQAMRAGGVVTMIARIDSEEEQAAIDPCVRELYGL